MDITMNTAQPKPTQTGAPAVWDLVIADMRQRDAIGRDKYGTRLQVFNGRDALVDAYQEALDLAVYLRQAIYEREVCKVCACNKKTVFADLCLGDRFMASHALEQAALSPASVLSDGLEGMAQVW